jgi:hypothetical protein
MQKKNVWGLFSRGAEVTQQQFLHLTCILWEKNTDLAWAEVTLHVYGFFQRFPILQL